MKFSNLKILNKIYDCVNINLSDRFYLIGTQHLMQTTGSLIEYFIKVNLLPNHIFLNGKIYSTNQQVVHELKEKGINIFSSTYNESQDLGSYKESLENDIRQMLNYLKNLKGKNIILMDDGGLTISNIFDSLIQENMVIGIEQTTSGQRLLKKLKFPVISVAASAVKKYLEPQIVVDSVFLKLERRFINKRIGVVGYGTIGKTLVQELNRRGYSVFVYDRQTPLNSLKYMTICKSLDECINNSDVLIGTTGEDITNNLDIFLNVNSDKKLISISSGDIEFNTLLREANKYLSHDIKSPLQDLTLKVQGGHRITILRGGMVANFTGSLNSGRPKLIQLTRALLLAGVIQAIKDTDKLIGINEQIMLSPEMQKFIVQEWIKDQPHVIGMYPKELLKNFQDIDWITENSAGKNIK